MIVRRIELRNFCKFTQPLVLDNLPGGLVVISGANEDGKSTLLAALRAAFFYKHSWTGDAVDRLCPTGSDVSPEVGVEFEIAGARYGIRKVFRRGHAAELRQLPGATFSGDAAEEKLAQLLGVPQPGRATGAGEAGGPLGLLWMTQGGAWHNELTAAGREGLKAALHGEVGDMVGGERAPAILQAVKDRCNQLLTPKDRKPTGELRALTAKADELAAALGSLQANIATYDHDRQGLAESLARRGKLQAQQPGAEERYAAAERDCHNAGEQQLALERQHSRLDAAQQRAELTKRGLDTRDELRQRIEALRGEQHERAGQVAVAQQSVDALETAAQAAARQTQEAGQALQEAEARLAALLRQIRYQERAAKLLALQEQQRSAEAARQRARQLRAAAQPLVDEAALQRLRRCDRERAAAAAALAAAATRVEVETAGGYEAWLDGAPLPGAALITQRARIELRDASRRVAEVRITPASATSDPLAAAQKAKQAWEAAATPYGLTTLAEAEQQRDRRVRQEAEAEAAEREAQRWAPEELEALHLQVETVRVALGPAPDEAAVAPERLHAEHEAADARERACRQAAQAAATESKLAEERLDHAQQRRAAAQREQAQAQEKLHATQDEFEQAESGHPSTELRARLMAETAAAQALELECRRLQAALAALDPQRLQRQLDVARGTREQLTREMNALEGAIQTARGRLQRPQAWGEQLQAAEEERAYVEPRRDELRRRADALLLLHETLQAAQAQAEQQFFAPVARHLAPYLRQLMPEAKIQLNAALAIDTLRRPGQAEPFGQLSLGTREQLAILVRLAFADVLRAEGKPALVILDDAPAYADDVRFRRMLEILFGAAQERQILLLTCREDQFRSSGGSIVPLRTAQAHATHP